MRTCTPRGFYCKSFYVLPPHLALSVVAAAAGEVTAALALAASAPAAEQVAEGMAGAGAGAEAVGAVRSAVGRGVAATAMWETAVAEEEELRTL